MMSRHHYTRAEAEAFVATYNSGVRGADFVARHGLRTGDARRACERLGVAWPEAPAAGATVHRFRDAKAPPVAPFRLRRRSA